MPNRFPNTPTFTGLNRPCRIEGVINDLEYDGQLPAGLRGTFYRCGPDPRFPPLLGDDININGDGMAQCLSLRRRPCQLHQPLRAHGAL